MAYSDSEILNIEKNIFYLDLDIDLHCRWCLLDCLNNLFYKESMGTKGTEHIYIISGCPTFQTFSENWHYQGGL